MNVLVQAAAIGTAAIIAAAGTWWIKGPPVRTLQCDPASLSPGEICLEQIPPDAEILWVDARPRDEWMENGLPGSILWNLEPDEDMAAFEAEGAMRIFENPRVVVYCGDEACGVSRQVAARIHGLGLDAEVSVLFGGWRALQEAGWVKDSSSGP